MLGPFPGSFISPTPRPRARVLCEVRDPRQSLPSLQDTPNITVAFKELIAKESWEASPGKPEMSLTQPWLPSEGPGWAVGKGRG